MPPRVTPTSVLVHGGDETCVEVNGSQLEKKGCMDHRGGHTHLSANVTILQIQCLKKVA